MLRWLWLKPRYYGGVLVAPCTAREKTDCGMCGRRQSVEGADHRRDLAGDRSSWTITGIAVDEGRPAVIDRGSGRRNTVAVGY